jgi:intracellular septation protein
MQLLFDFLPIIAFFAAFKLTKDMFVATAVLLVASVLQVTVHWMRTRRVNKMHLVSAGLALVFGGLTLAVHDTAFIKWKFTIVQWLFAAAFLASMWRRFSERPLVQRLIGASGTEIPLTEAQWRRLNGTWVAFFLLMGAANLAAFHYLDDDAWVDFKMYGTVGLTMLFVVGQGFWIASRMENHDEPAG